MRDPRDDRTLDLLAWEPDPLVKRFDDDRVRSPSLAQRIALGVAETLRASPLSRDEIAAAASDWLGETISKAMLDAYASQARADHNISLLRAIAIMQVTGDRRLLQMAAELFGLTVIEKRYLPWVDVGRLADKKQKIDRQFELSRHLARKGLRP